LNDGEIRAPDVVKMKSLGCGVWTAEVATGFQVQMIAPGKGKELVLNTEMTPKIDQRTANLRYRQTDLT